MTRIEDVARMPLSRKRIASSAISRERAACRIAVTRHRTTMGPPCAAAACSPSTKPASTASTTSSSDNPRTMWSSGANRISAYTTESAARS
ncbi:MAG: hypothetical protein QOG19_3084, partial [Mycobacterium sp.]|nr:hypothetical protein [Mycobacterium sp.]